MLSEYYAIEWNDQVKQGRHGDVVSSRASAMKSRVLKGK